MDSRTTGDVSAVRPMSQQAPPAGAADLAIYVRLHLRLIHMCPLSRFLKSSLVTVNVISVGVLAGAESAATHGRCL